MYDLAMYDLAMYDLAMYDLGTFGEPAGLRDLSNDRHSAIANRRS
jgi:hypothetical protein